VGGAGAMLVIEDKYTSFWWEELKERDDLEDQSVKWRIIK
jgi:hypothetical protein